jgi:hypothetical protein
VRLAKKALALLVAAALWLVLDVAFDWVMHALDYYVPCYPLILIAFGVFVLGLATKYGWDGDWRLTRLVNRPRFVDETHRGQAVAGKGVVPRKGLEPSRPLSHWHLKPARLPIPPPGHGRA